MYRIKTFDGFSKFKLKGMNQKYQNKIAMELLFDHVYYHRQGVYSQIQWKRSSETLNIQ